MLLNQTYPYYIVSFNLKSKEKQEFLMATATVTSKGQVTIPITVRSALGLESGDRLEFVEVERGRFEIVAASSSIRSLKGKISKPKKPVSIEEMNRIVAGKGMSAK